MSRLRQDQVRVLEERVAQLPVEVADHVLDKAFHASGIAWLRRNGWLPPVDTAVDTAVAS